MITYIKGEIKLSADLIAKSNAAKTAKQSTKPKTLLKLEKQYFRHPQQNHSLASSWCKTTPSLQCQEAESFLFW